MKINLTRVHILGDGHPLGLLFAFRHAIAPNAADWVFILVGVALGLAAGWALSFRDVLDARRLRELVDADPRLLLEDKGPSLAIHYRQAPDREGELEDLMGSLLTGLKGYRLLCGKMVFELLPAKSGKGQAIETYMEQSPYRGRRPVFAGDDVTDEDGFAVVQAMGGAGIKVGPGESQARYRLDDVPAVHTWLTELTCRLSTSG